MIKEWSDQFNSFNSLKGMLYMEWYRAILEGKFLPPIEASVDPANACNLDCVWCLEEDTNILMSDFTIKKINTLQIGDEIISVNKNKQIVKDVVKKTFSRYVNENIYSIKLDNGVTINCTGNHRIFHTRGRWKQAMNFVVGDKVNVIHNYTYNINNSEFERGWLCGVADGDGCFWTQKIDNRRQFRIAVKDIEIIERFYNLSHKYGYKVYNGKADSKYRHGDYSLPALYLTQHKEVNKFENWLHCHSTMDYVHGWLAGIFDAEGSYSGSNLRISQDHIANKDIYTKIQTYLDLVNIDYKPEPDSIIVNKRQDNKVDFFIKCNPVLKRKYENILNQKLSSIARVLSVSCVKKETKVYNFETNTNTYFANGILVHNCNGYDVHKRNVMMSSEHLLDLVRFFKSWGVKGICFAGGGEPTLQPDLYKAIDLCGDLKLPVAIITNGTRFSNALIDSMALNCRWVGVSVDAASSQIYEKLKKFNQFNHVIENICKLVNAGCREVTYKFLLHPENQYEVFKAIELAKDLGCHRIHIRPISYINYQDHEDSYDINSINDQVTKGRELYESDRFRVFYIQHKFNKDLHRKFEFEKCLATPLMPIFQANGDISICIDRKSDKSLVIGIHDDVNKIKEIWGSDKHKQIINSIKINECPKCTLNCFNEIIEKVVINNQMDWEFT